MNISVQKTIAVYRANFAICNFFLWQISVLIQTIFSTGYCVIQFSLVHSTFKRYEGYLKNGRFDGHGLMFAKDGSNYKGEWKNSRMHGYGIRTFSESSPFLRFEGNHEDGFPMGKGTLYFKDGERHVGQFCHYFLKGYGVRYSSEGKIIEQGQFVNGVWDRKALAA